MPARAQVVWNINYIGLTHAHEPEWTFEHVTNQSSFNQTISDGSAKQITSHTIDQSSTPRQTTPEWRTQNQRKFFGVELRSLRSTDNSTTGKFQRNNRYTQFTCGRVATHSAYFPTPTTVPMNFEPKRCRWHQLQHLGCSLGILGPVRFVFYCPQSRKTCVWHLANHVCISVYLCLSLSISVCLCLKLFVSDFSVWLCLALSVSLFISVCHCLSVSLCLCLFLFRHVSPHASASAFVFAFEHVYASGWKTARDFFHMGFGWGGVG